jgi:hypothetical protein
VRRGLKAAIVWTGVFAACAGAGAFVAAHTDPFPPGVEDPGSRPTETPSASPAEAAERWNMVMVSATRHDLHVGGSCTSTWRSTGVVTVGPDGTVGGRATARLRHWSCDFPVAQIQTKSVLLTVTGSADRRLVLDFAEVGTAPSGSQDLGGFIATIGLLESKVAVQGGHGGAAASASRPDGDLGRYVNDGEIQLDCASGC